MNKTELITKVSETMGTTKKASGEAIDAIFGVISDTVSNGEKVSISGFGTFDITERAERQGRNPSTGETMVIAASKSPKFKAASAFKASVNK